MEQRSEVEELRARVAELERELADRTERANAAVAAAEDRLYWLDRWRVDLEPSDGNARRRSGRSGSPSRRAARAASRAGSAAACAR